MVNVVENKKNFALIKVLSNGSFKELIRVFHSSSSFEIMIVNAIFEGISNSQEPSQFLDHVETPGAFRSI